MVRKSKMEAKLDAFLERSSEDRRMAEERHLALEESIARLGERMAQMEARMETVERRPHTQQARNGGNSDGDENSANRRSRGGEQWRRIELPLFNGEDAHGWLDRVDRYFEIRGVPEEDWLDVAKIAMEGPALTWFKWWETTTTDYTWESFRPAVVRRFQPSLARNPFTALMSLKQTGSVRDYRHQFEQLASSLKIRERRFLDGLFINGLHEEVSSELDLHHFNTIDEMMDMAELVEVRNRAWAKDRIRPSTVAKSWTRESSFSKGNLHDRSGPMSNSNRYSAMSSTGNYGGPNKDQRSQPGEPEGDKTKSGSSRTGFRYISDEEMRDKRLKGLCFTCEEKYSRDHICKNKGFRLMLLEEDQEGAPDVEWHDARDDLKDATCQVQLSCKSMKGNNSPRSIRAWGEVAGHKVRVLIDPGASDNFICPSLVKEATLPVKEATFVVTVASGEQTKGQGRCNQLTIKFPNLEVMEDFYIFPLDNSELVLGLAWLDKLGDTLTNFGKSRLTIQTGDRWTILQGAPELCYGGTALRAALKDLSHESPGFIVQLWPVVTQLAHTTVTPSRIQ